MRSRRLSSGTLLVSIPATAESNSVSATANSSAGVALLNSCHLTQLEPVGPVDGAPGPGELGECSGSEHFPGQSNDPGLERIDPDRDPQER